MQHAGGTGADRSARSTVGDRGRSSAHEEGRHMDGETIDFRVSPRTAQEIHPIVKWFTCYRACETRGARQAGRRTVRAVHQRRRWQ